MQILMPPLQEKWTSIADNDRDLLPLFECFTSLAQALCAPQPTPVSFCTVVIRDKKPRKATEGSPRV